MAATPRRGLVDTGRGVRRRCVAPACGVRGHGEGPGCATLRAQRGGAQATTRVRSLAACARSDLGVAVSEPGLIRAAHRPAHREPHPVPCVPDGWRSRTARTQSRIGRLRTLHNHPRVRMRKFVVCRLMSEGNRIEDVCKFIGHRSMSTTFGTYWDVQPQELLDGMRIPCSGGATGVAPTDAVDSGGGCVAGTPTGLGPRPGVGPREAVLQQTGAQGIVPIGGPNRHADPRTGSSRSPTTRPPYLSPTAAVPFTGTGPIYRGGP